MYQYKAIVTKVYDGDSVTCDVDLGFEVWLKGVKCRLYGIDTPELRGESREAGIAARDRLKELLAASNNEVIMVSHGKGKFGRWLVGLFTPPGVVGDSLNWQLRREGHAVAYHGGRRTGQICSAADAMESIRSFQDRAGWMESGNIPTSAEILAQIADGPVPPAYIPHNYNDNDGDVRWLSATEIVQRTNDAIGGQDTDADV